MSAWKEFFGHSFWEKDNLQKSASTKFELQENMKANLLRVNVEVKVKNKVSVPLSEFQGKLPKGSTLVFSVNPLVKYNRVVWIVNNSGDEAGTDITHEQIGRVVVENTAYRGSHTMTCKVFEGSRLIAQKVIPINIK